MSKESFRLISVVKSALMHSSEQLTIGLLGWAGAIIAGLMLFGPLIVNWDSPAFQYVILGAGASALFVAWKERGFLESTTYALAFALYCAIPARDLFFSVFVNSALFFLCACACYQIFWSRAWHRLVFGKFILLGAAFALFELAKTAAIPLLLSESQIAQTSTVNAVLRGTLGLGVGAGVEIGEAIVHSFVHHHR